MKLFILILILHLFVFHSFSQSFSGVLEYKKESIFQQPDNKKRTLNTKTIVILTENKEKIITEEDFLGQGKTQVFTSVVDANSYYYIDSISKTVTRMYSEPLTYLDQFKIQNNNSGKLIKTDSINVIYGVECRMYTYSCKVQSSFCLTEYFITNKYGIRFKMRDDILKNSYGIVLKRVTKIYDDESRKHLSSQSVLTINQIKEMKIDEKEFELPEGWPIHTVNMTSKLKHMGIE